MTIEEMKAKKIELGLTNEMIAEASDVPLSTIQKIFGGATKAPRKSTIEAIEKVLRGEELMKTLRDDPEYTLDDYYALPDDQRAELIDGKFYFMNAPTLLHQLIVTALGTQFFKCIEDHDMPCEVFVSPCDVRLDEDNYTMVQPDLIVTCKEIDLTADKRLEGAPDLAVEVLSPSSRSHDMILKLYKYRQAGVREYWIIDPQNKSIVVYYFEDENYFPKSYGFDDTIPVGISDGKCSIDFSKISKRIYKKDRG